MATVIYTAVAKQQFDTLSLPIRQRIEKVVIRLGKWPQVSGARPLRGNLAGQYRIRTGDYRVQFTVSAAGELKIVTIVKVGHRDGFYDD